MLGKIKAWWYMKARKNIKGFWEKLVEKARTINSDSTIVESFNWQ
ncbi:hypothetical protein ETSB_0003 [cyanobacterium endosymbiont of Epithemia turgida isolate EtSB Lake Yunoko]|nr:hypothetical protein ETSB_0003 [cyanobacterium endosymbiont of Epithemia turgida isolate EtSB Lake Yunoko]